MFIRHILFIIASILLVWACAPKQALPPLLKPTEPPGAEVIDYTSLFQEAEALFADQLFEEALEKYGSYLENQPQGVHADMALKRTGDMSRSAGCL